MNKEELRAIQAPLKEQYRNSPETALVTLRARASLGGNVTCDVQTARGVVDAGLHPASGGTGASVCSGDMLLQALVGCAGVTLSAVATALGIHVRGASLIAEGDLDFRGTLGVDREAPVGFREIRLTIDLDSDASPAQRAKLLELTERYCVVYQTLVRGTAVNTRAPLNANDR